MDEPITAERWERIESLLDAALTLPFAQRAAFVARSTGDDESLRLQVQKLLDRAETRGDVLDRPASDALVAPAAVASLQGGSRVGVYRVLELVGRGGMGEVYRAERADGQYQQQVALKLVRREAVEHIARFESERRMLARLDHPGIARLFDGGVTEDGRPYMVMEWVEGRTITQWCRETGADLRQRLDIFVQVCEAVAYAHHHLLVHRDLKPDNVLVTADGRSKLLDFGVAKLLSASSDAYTLTQAPITPAYAAPEQLVQAPITTATDVYALGLLLFELLTGERTWHRPGMPLAQLMQKQLQEKAPAVSATAARLPTPPISPKALQGDLDAIVGRALRSDAARRYQSAAELAEDLRRYLDGRPVLARPESLSYSLGKFARRNRVSAAFAGLALAALVIGLVSSLWQAREAARQRDAAWVQLGRASATNEFMGFLLSVAAPAGQKFSVGELLAEGEKLADKQFAENDPLRAEMLTAIGQQYMISEHWDEATSVMERAAGISAKSGDPALRARTLCPLALLDILNGNPDKAKAIMAEALAQLPDKPEYRLQRAECLTRFSEFGFFTGEGEPMIRNATTAIELLRQIPIKSASKLIDAQAAQAYGYYLSRQNRKADEAFAQVVSALEASGRERTTAAADVLNNWALVHFQGNIAKAEPLCRRVVELHRLIEGGDSIVPTATFNHAGVLVELARFDEAEKLLQETIRTAEIRKEFRIQTDATMRLADVYTQTGQLEKAAEQLAKLAPLMESPRFDNMRRAQLAYYQGHLAQARGDMPLARTLLKDSVARFDKSKARIALNVHALIGLARAEQAAGEGAAAITIAGQAITLAQSFVEAGAPSYLVGLSQMLLGDLQAANGQPEAAKATFKTAVGHLEQTLGEDHPATKAAKDHLAHQAPSVAAS